MKLKEITEILDQMAPLAYAEDFDNVGLLVSHPNEINGILVCHDALEEVIDEAITKNCNLVVCFHPILFTGLKKITGKNYVDRSIIKAIKNDVAIYAVHTALDNHFQGVNKIFCDAIGVKNTKILIPKENFIFKLITFVPKDNANTVREALFTAGAGQIGNYEKCSFTSLGTGSFMGNENSNAVFGEKFEYIEDEEMKVEVIFEKHLKNKVLKALRSAHKYEEVPYELYQLMNEHQNIGLGMLGELNNPMPEKDFFEMIKIKLDCGGIRHSKFLNKPIKTVAVLGGSGSFAIKNAKNAKADVFLTSDLKYHQYYEAENEIVIADIGHFESERFTKNYIVDFLTKKITNFAHVSLKGGINLSEINTNPVQYF